MNRVSAGGLLEFVAAAASAGIAVSLYPVLKQRSGGLALGAVVFRTIEAVMYTVGKPRHDIRHTGQQHRWPMMAPVVDTAAPLR
jgi:hypothetical protein